MITKFIASLSSEEKAEVCRALAIDMFADHPEQSIHQKALHNLADYYNPDSKESPVAKIELDSNELGFMMRRDYLGATKALRNRLGIEHAEAKKIVDKMSGKK